MSSTVLKCICKHDFQDRHHGRSMRVHNLTGDGKTWVCTVCRQETTRKVRVVLPTDDNG